MGRLYDALEKAEREKYGDELKVPITTVKKVAFQNRFSSDLVVIHEPGSLISEEFRFLRSRIIRGNGHSQIKTILITSCLQGEGKSFVSANLAATIAKGLDEYVLLVDADLRRSSIHRLYGLDYVKRGLSTYLYSEEPLEDLLCKTSIDKLTILPAGEDAPMPSELLSSNRMKELVGEVRDRYPDRYVIFDSSPVELTPETFVLAGEVDAIYLVVRCAHTPRELVKNTIEKFDRNRFKGIIFNGYENKKKYYGKNGKNYRYSNAYR